MNNQSFERCFCLQHQIPRERFAREVFNRSLYPHARCLRWILVFFDAGYFSADFDLIHNAGMLRRVRDAEEEFYRFNIHPANRGWLRRKWLLRVSTKRLRSVVRESLHQHAGQIFKADENGSAVPFHLPKPVERAGTKSKSIIGVGV